MKQFKLSFTMYRESFSGRDQCDGIITETVNAKNYEDAEDMLKQLVKKHMDPGPGRVWSQYRWITNESIVEV